MHSNLSQGRILALIQSPFLGETWTESDIITQPQKISQALYLLRAFKPNFVIWSIAFQKKKISRDCIQHVIEIIYIQEKQDLAVFWNRLEEHA